MATLLSVLTLVLAVDQAIKLLVRNIIGHRSVSLGLLGSLHIVQNKIWLLRASRRWSVGAMWIVWLACATVSGIICAMAPDYGWAFGLLLGGGVSHAIETSLRGSICDYICLRFWPAFDLADVALSAGAIGAGIKIAAAVL
jgi:lipoprotein signal peptidase